jgi:hypothetical protein
MADDSSRSDRLERYQAAIRLIASWTTEDEEYDELVGRALDGMLADAMTCDEEDSNLPSA